MHSGGVLCKRTGGPMYTIVTFLDPHTMVPHALIFAHHCLEVYTRYTRGSHEVYTRSTRGLHHWPPLQLPAQIPLVYVEGQTEASATSSERIPVYTRSA